MCHLTGMSIQFNVEDWTKVACSPHFRKQGAASNKKEVFPKNSRLLELFRSAQIPSPTEKDNIGTNSCSLLFTFAYSLKRPLYNYHGQAGELDPRCRLCDYEEESQA